jgi:hypothetical protein
MHEPFYVRPPDFHYCLRSNPTYGGATGVAEYGSLAGAGVEDCHRGGPDLWAGMS